VNSPIPSGIGPTKLLQEKSMVVKIFTTSTSKPLLVIVIVLRSRELLNLFEPSDSHSRSTSKFKDRHGYWAFQLVVMQINTFLYVRRNIGKFWVDQKIGWTGVLTLAMMEGKIEKLEYSHSMNFHTSKEIPFSKVLPTEGK
jgi:hypothetical protein